MANRRQCIQLCVVSHCTHALKTISSPYKFVTTFQMKAYRYSNYMRSDVQPGYSVHEGNSYCGEGLALSVSGAGQEKSEGLETYIWPGLSA